MGDGPIGRKAVFLDRDGVINRMLTRGGKPGPPKRVDELEILPGVRPALEGLKAAGLVLVVVTNQPDVARGTLPREAVEQVNDRLMADLPLDAVRTCFHDDADECECRKPKPGLLVQAARELDLALDESYMVGDRWRDVEAGKRAGCAQVLVESPTDANDGLRPDVRVKSLVEAAAWILARETQREDDRS